MAETDCPGGLRGLGRRSERREYLPPVVEWVEPVCHAILGGSPGTGDSGSGTVQYPPGSPVSPDAVAPGQAFGPIAPGDGPAWAGAAAPGEPPPSRDPFAEVPPAGGDPNAH